MHKQKFTPGDWVHSPNYHCAHELKGAKIVARDKTIATVSAREVNSQEECENNARIMSFSKDMLKALKAVIDCESGFDENGHAYLKVPSRSMFDLGAEINELIKRIEKKE